MSDVVAGAVILRSAAVYHRARFAANRFSKPVYGP